MAAWLTNTPMNGHGPWMPMMQDCSKRIQKICYLPHPNHHWSPVNGSLWLFFSSNPFYHPLRHGMHRRDRNLGIFLITQVITICCWIDSHRGPNIPHWNRQENSAYIYIYIWRLASYRSRIPSLKFIHVFQSRNVKREMFKTRWPWFCSRLVAENHWDYLYNLKIQVFFHYKEFCIIQLSLIGNFCRSLGAVHVILFWARNAQMSILDLLAWLQLSTSL